jgi:hypothetical protein
LKSQLAAKQTALEQAKTDDEKTKLNTEITALKAEIAAAQAAEKTSGQQASGTSTKSTGAQDGRPRWEGSKPPQSKISSEVMDVLMQLSQNGMPPGGMGGAERPSAADLYADMDADSNGAVTKDEFVAARPEHASEEDATKFYNSIDTKGTGSITEEQFTTSMESKGGPGGRGGPHMGPPGGAPGMDGNLQQLLASLTASGSTETIAA